jgi:MoaA/NifB/PqqE/SkfB family radical SAM enzyme
MRLSPVLERLPILILSPHARCNCRCMMCDIWKTTEATEISADDLERHVASIEGMGVEWVVLSGGEPLMHSDLFRLCGVLRARGVRITILSTGLLLEKHAAGIVANIDEVIVSLDGPPDIHDAVRRVPGAFARLASGVRAIHELRADFAVTARCTVQRLNHAHVRATVGAAREIGLQGISFLAADVASTAFNRLEVWAPERQATVALTGTELAVLDAEIDGLITACDGFVAESAEKLRRIADHFRAHLGTTESVAPGCNAPWVSAVVEADGTVRPCFFHRAVGRIDGSTTLGSVINGADAIAFRTSLDVASNPICRRCVCSLRYEPRLPGAVTRPA